MLAGREGFEPTTPRFGDARSKYGCELLDADLYVSVEPISVSTLLNSIRFTEKCGCFRLCTEAVVVLWVVLLFSYLTG